MTDRYRPQTHIQTCITDFQDYQKQHVRIKEELNKNMKPLAQWHLEESIRLFLKLKKDPPTLGTLFGFIIDSLTKMEGKEICYLKRMPDGKIYAFRRAYCWEGVGNWKKCPEFRCLIQFPCCDLPCPNGDNYYENPLDNLDEDKKKELKSFMKKLEEESSGKQD